MNPESWYDDSIMLEIPRPFTTKKWIKCGHGAFRGDPCCRHCDPVERINVLAEEFIEIDFELSYQNYKANAYIHAVDIILESE